jgi:hypothetical protein
MKRSSKSSPRWRVTRIVGAKAREVCELEAKSADWAITVPPANIRSSLRSRSG